jgi:hypothetical protein
MVTAHIEDIEAVLVAWRHASTLIEESDMRYADRGLYEDYHGATAALAAVLTRYTTFAQLLASWERHALGPGVRRACVLKPGRGALRPHLLEGAAYWRRMRQLVAASAG